jgi:ribosomal protein S18 acetylase RimI-like enzyme
MGLTIRDATIADAERIASLITELGYPTLPEQMTGRLEAILGDDSYRTLVGCDGATIAGVVGLRVGPMYEMDEPYGQIMVLVIAAEYRRRGIGGRLVQAAESFFVARGARVAVITSAHRRADAHAFYESHGYAFDGRRYKKALPPATSEAI